MSRIAITRPVSPRFQQCELTHLTRRPIDLGRARAQHRAYENALSALGYRVRQLSVAPDYPDSVFVEDTAVVTDEVAVITRPGAASRRGETSDVATVLASLRPVRRIEAPGTLDGGDVLQVGKRVFVGRSSRTNEAGIRQLRGLLEGHGYAVTAVDFHGCLHLKTAVTQVGERTLLFQPAWVDPDAFDDFELVAVDPQEPWAANALWLGSDDVLFPAGFPATADRLQASGATVHEVDVSEMAKAEGGVTCCSILVDTST